VLEREKEWLRQELKKNFTVPAESEEAAKCCTLSKMAEQLQTFKKNLMKNYIKKGKTPEFTRDLAKQKDHWNAFVSYKSSELGIRNVEKAKENASKKVSSHSMARWVQAGKTKMGEDGAGFD